MRAGLLFSINFHFQCIRKSLCSTAIPQLGRIRLAALVFNVRGFQQQVFMVFQHNNIFLHFLLKFYLLLLLFNVIESLSCVTLTGTEIIVINTSQWKFTWFKHDDIGSARTWRLGSTNTAKHIHLLHVTTCRSLTCDW